MTYTLREKNEKIIRKCLTLTSTNVYELFMELTTLDCVAMHGPEHHVLDGACLLIAYRNATGQLDLETALTQLLTQGEKMPGAMCGQWGVCGATASVGAALAIIDKTGPLSIEDWGEHMKLTSKIINDMSNIGGPRCCKRNGLIALKNAVEYMNSHYNLELEWTDPICNFSNSNKQCILMRCPFYPQKKKKVAFICVHNSCRSQIAEALGKHLASDSFEFYSAGTIIKTEINQDAVRLMKELYNIDMEKTQYSKLIQDIPEPDIVISMGCDVGCPYIGHSFDDNWNLEDPTGKSDSDYENVIKQIECKILELKNKF